MKQFSKKKQKITALSVLVILIVVGVALSLLLNKQDTVPQGMRQVKSFDANGACQAINEPECGYCPGEVDGDKCYVKQGVLENRP